MISGDSSLHIRIRKPNLNQRKRLALNTRYFRLLFRVRVGNGMIIVIYYIFCSLLLKCDTNRVENMS